MDGFGKDREMKESTEKPGTVASQQKSSEVSGGMSGINTKAWRIHNGAWRTEGAYDL